MTITRSEQALEGRNKQQLAREFLARVRDDLDRAKRVRVEYVRAARAHGLDDAEIARELGLSEDAVRVILERRTVVAR